MSLTHRQLDGLDCVVCGGSYGPMEPTGAYADGVALFAHAHDCRDQTPPASSGPPQADVDALRHLLDIAATFSDNDQRARFILTSNWMRDRDRRLASPRSAAA